MKSMSKFLFAMGVLGVAIVLDQRASAYDRYEAGGLSNGVGCVECHPGFVNEDTTHQLHVDGGMMSGSTRCGLCHMTTGGGDIPVYTHQSASNGGQGCRGCHGVNNGTSFGWGVGLRRVHARPTVNPDSQGKRCVACHSTDPAPSAESTLPVYYTNNLCRIKNPCLAKPAPPGEDFTGDGKGLDNDGNGLYDENDPACSFRIISIVTTGNDVRVSWQSVVGVTNYLQATAGNSGRSYYNNYVDLNPMIVTAGSVVVVTNRLELGGATNRPARYYRLRSPR